MSIPVISLQKSVTELERCESLQRTTLECYRAVIGAIREYAVEIEAVVTRQHQERLAAITQELDKDPAAEAMLGARREVRDELRDYHDRAAEYLGSLREELSSTAHSLQEIIDSIVSNGGDQEQRLKNNFARLRSLSQCEDIEQLRRGLRSSIDAIEDCIEQFRKENQLVVTELRDELNILHKMLDRTRAAAAEDPVTGVLNRQEMQARLRREIAAGTVFSLVFLWIRNFKHLQHEVGRHLVDQAIIAFRDRLRRAADPRATLGRWGDDEFAVLLRVDAWEADRCANSLASRLRGPYDCGIAPETRTLVLEVSAGVVDQHESGEIGGLLDGTDETLRVLEGSP